MPQHAARPAGAVYEADDHLSPLQELSDEEGSVRTIFDHQGHVSGRRRPAHDWGADDLFNQTPRSRRFDRVDAHARHLELVVDEPGAEPPVAPEPSAALVEQMQPLAEPESERPVALERAPAPGPAGRRTVTITGRPGEHVMTSPRPDRRRPPRTFEDRFGARPDRIASWACGLGFLLILIAVSTADAAPL
jgi:hypothetical protein